MKKFFDLLKEIWLRLWSKSPYLFRIIQRISAFFASLSGLALILQGLNVELPGVIQWASSWTIAISAILGWLVAKLPIDEDKASPEVKKAIAENSPPMDAPE